MPTETRPRLLVINAALAGENGNTVVLLDQAARLLKRRAQVERVTLATSMKTEGDFAALRPRLDAADGFLFGTGTHWDSWSSMLQKFLEDATPAEGTRTWLGKPAAAIVTEHSTGGKGVLSRLQGVLVTLGCTLPPMSGLVLSRAAWIAAKNDAAAARDFWCEADVGVVCHNLAEAAKGVVAARERKAASAPRWKTWPVDRRDVGARWLEQ